MFVSDCFGCFTVFCAFILLIVFCVGLRSLVLCFACVFFAWCVVFMVAYLVACLRLLLGHCCGCLFGVVRFGLV